MHQKNNIGIDISSKAKKKKKFIFDGSHKKKQFKKNNIANKKGYIGLIHENNNKSD